MAESIKVCVDIIGGAHLPEPNPNIHKIDDDGRWMEIFPTPPRYGDAYIYAEVVNKEQWHGHDPATVTYARAFVVGIEWRPVPKKLSMPMIGPSTEPTVMPFVLISEKNPFTSQ